MKRFYTTTEFCAAFGVKKTKLYSLIAANDIQAVKAGPKTLIPVESAEAWAASLPRFKSAAANASDAA